MRITRDIAVSGRESTLYWITMDNGAEYSLHLWVIAGGTPAISLRDYLVQKRLNELNWVTTGDDWPGPRLWMLPDGFLDDYLTWAIPELAKVEQERAIQKRIEETESATKLPKYKWPVREPEEEPRLIPCKRISADKYICLASSLAKALKGAPGNNKGTVLWGDVIMGVTQIRQYVKALLEGKADVDCRLDITMHADVVEIECTLAGPLKKSCRIKHGAWDKFRGLSGWDCELVWDIH